MRSGRRWPGLVAFLLAASAAATGPGLLETALKRALEEQRVDDLETVFEVVADPGKREKR